jgi:hypothetical protein
MVVGLGWVLGGSRSEDDNPGDDGSRGDVTPDDTSHGLDGIPESGRRLSPQTSMIWRDSPCYPPPRPFPL